MARALPPPAPVRHVDTSEHDARVCLVRRPPRKAHTSSPQLVTRVGCMQPGGRRGVEERLEGVEVAERRRKVPHRRRRRDGGNAISDTVAVAAAAAAAARAIAAVASKAVAATNAVAAGRGGRR
eukprot:349678-Chlamydomonas_euryale.AAC.3